MQKLWKICTKCGSERDISEFGKRKNRKTETSSWCLKCSSDFSREYRRTRHGIIVSIYNSQRTSSKKRGMIPPRYSVEELEQWVFSRLDFEKLYGAWVASSYDKWLKPSVDRLDDYEPYSIDNIQLMTWGENADKGHKDRFDGINNKKSKAIIQRNIHGDFICGYSSAAIAGRELNIDSSDIRKACKGKKKTVGGFVWEYV